MRAGVHLCSSAASYNLRRCMFCCAVLCRLHFTFIPYLHPSPFEQILLEICFDLCFGTSTVLGCGFLHSKGSICTSTEITERPRRAACACDMHSCRIVGLYAAPFALYCAAGLCVCHQAAGTIPCMPAHCPVRGGNCDSKGANVTAILKTVVGLIYSPPTF